MGGKGGPLAFLNKKGWHPGSIQNQEKVWKREEEHLKELKKAEELRKQIAEEREKEELRAVAEAAGVLK
jgi:N-terminal domain of CBF1 interacting co-repressor CIR